MSCSEYHLEHSVVRCVAIITIICTNKGAEDCDSTLSPAMAVKPPIWSLPSPRRKLSLAPSALRQSLCIRSPLTLTTSSCTRHPHSASRSSQLPPDPQRVQTGQPRRQLLPKFVESGGMGLHSLCSERALGSVLGCKGKRQTRLKLAAAQMGTRGRGALLCKANAAQGSAAFLPAGAHRLPCIIL